MLSLMELVYPELLPRVGAESGGGTWGQGPPATGLSPKRGTDEATQLEGGAGRP